jgi:hypothetical protein
MSQPLTASGRANRKAYPPITQKRGRRVCSGAGMYTGRYRQAWGWPISSRLSCLTMRDSSFTMQAQRS